MHYTSGNLDDRRLGWTLGKREGARRWRALAEKGFDEGLRQGGLSSHAHIRCSMKCQGDRTNGRARGAIETAMIGRD
jgi:hypothetical protein